MNVLNPDIYTVAWIAPLPIEKRAALGMLDKRHQGSFALSPGDDYIYEAGEIGDHNVIIATFPDGQEYGTGTAAAIAGHIKKFFPRLWFGLLVGVAAGIPDLHQTPPVDIRLGDVLVGLPEGERAGLIAYDLGKETGDNGFQLLRLGHVLAQTEPLVRSAIGKIKNNAPDDAKIFLPYYEHLRDKEHSQGSFADPGQENDVLHEVDEKGHEYIASREIRPTGRRTRVWYGTIGSGDKLVKNARKRNELRDRYNVIGLEMEAAGIMNRIPVGVIRGVCDYGDEHKNKQWQPYAAAMAASYAKAVLAQILPKVIVRVEGQTIDDGIASEVPSRPKRPLDNSISSVGNRRFKSPRNDESEANFSPTPSWQQGCLDEDRKKTIMDSLKFDQINSRHDNIKRAYGGTCEWLSRTPEYLAWLDPDKLHEHHGLLWIKGNPGAGKSTLMKVALQRTRRSKHSHCISFFFNARGDDLAKSTNGLYRSLLLQLLQKMPRLQSILDELEQTVQGEIIPQWSTESLQLLFEQAIQNLGQSPVRCFIDALDECDDAQIREMVSFFEELGEMAVLKGISFQVCLSSRHYPHITISRGLNLDLGQQRGHGQDIVNYVNGNVKIPDTGLAQQIRERLIEKASGVFIWIVLVIRILQKEHDDGHTDTLLQRLDDIPGNLNALFREILTRDNRHKAEVLLCIQWVLFARKPLDKEQLYLAIRVGVDPRAASVWNPDHVGDADVRRFILSSSKGLVEIKKSGKSPKVQFIHESVREFFFKEDFTAIWPELNGNFQGESHERLKQCCLDYIKIGAAYLAFEDKLSRPSDRLSTERKFPLLEYAFQNIIHHAEEAATSNINQSTFLRSFNVASWVRCESIFEKFKVRRHEPSATLLYILAEYNAANLIGYHGDKLYGFEEEFYALYGMPILAAIATNSHQAVYALLKAQADTEPPTSPLHSLCQQYLQSEQKRSFAMREFKFSRSGTVVDNLFNNGEDLVVSFLLATPARLNANIERGRAVNTQILCDAASGGREALVRWLLDQDVDINGSRDGRTVLLHAVLGNHQGIVQLLLDMKVNVDATSDYELPALHFAAKEGHADIVRLLLRHGVNLNSRSTQGNTPLHYAVHGGHPSTVQLLLDKGAEIETKANAQFTPLSLAIQMWADTGVTPRLDFEAADCLVFTPPPTTAEISAQTREKRKDVVQLLLDRGAIVNAADRNGDTPLTLARSLPNDDPLRPLILAKRIKREVSDSKLIWLDVIEILDD